LNAAESAARLPRAPRAPRSDALRNRDRLVEVARAAFAAAEEPVTLEGIAREAGVGIGTLYRHFPTRESLLEAVYAAELDDITSGVPELLEQLPPDAALRAWLGRYAAFFATKQGYVDTLRAGWATGRIATPATRERITAVLAAFLEAGAADGSLRADVAAPDVLTLLLGLFLASAADAAPEQIDRLLDLLLDSLRQRPAG
jgi:AcrR family transcriptional regulator